MKGKRYSEEQIFRILREGDSGVKVADCVGSKESGLVNSIN